MLYGGPTAHAPKLEPQALGQPNYRSRHPRISTITNGTVSHLQLFTGLINWRGNSVA